MIVGQQELVGLAGSTLYLRDRQQILALDLGDPGSAAAERNARPRTAPGVR